MTITSNGGRAIAALDELLTLWRAWQLSQSLSMRTITERAVVLRRLIADTGAHPLELTPLDIVSFTSRDGLKPATRATYHATIRAYCQWLILVELRGDDPTMRLPKTRRTKGKPRPVPDDGLVRMLEVVNRRRTRTMILLGALAGMRVHEIAKMHGHDLDRTYGTITVTGKGGKTALLPAHRLILEDAAGYPTDDYWFPSYTRGDEPITGGSVSSAVANVMRRAGLSTTPHQLRHWYGTSLVAAGVNLRIVQEAMRHDSAESTAIYTGVTLEQMRAAIDLLDLRRAA